jgi:hypothetical protein
MTILFFISLVVFIISIACLFALYILSDISYIKVNKLALAVKYLVITYFIVAVVIIGFFYLLKPEFKINNTRDNYCYNCCNYSYPC